MQMRFLGAFWDSSDQGKLMLNVTRLRSRFPTLAGKVYLNSGSHGLLCLEAEEALLSYLADWREHGAYWDGWIGRYEAVRQSTARLLGCEADEIAMQPSVSGGINAVASALDFTGERDKIVLSNFEFPTSAQIWHAQALRGARIEHVAETQDGYIPIEHFEEAIDGQTRIVSISHVCYRNGAKLDIERIVEIAKRHGALVIVDAYQTIGTETLDVKQAGVDFAVGGTMKYLLGGAGVGFLYVRDELVGRLAPTTTGWYAQADFGAMDIFANTPSPTARRFEAGTPAVPALYTAEAGLNVIHELGTDAIGNHIRTLTRRAMEGLSAAGWQIATPDDDARRGPMLAIRSKDEAALVHRLAGDDIVVSCRDGNIRAGFHLYNDDDDVERLLAALDRHGDLRL